MKTVRNAYLLQQSALTIKHSDQIEQHDELIGAEEDGQAFFERTYITQGMVKNKVSLIRFDWMVSH
jgi:hypothetical protein